MFLTLRICATTAVMVCSVSMVVGTVGTVSIVSIVSIVGIVAMVGIVSNASTVSVSSTVRVYGKCDGLMLLTMLTMLTMVRPGELRLRFAFCERNEPVSPPASSITRYLDTAAAQKRVRTSEAPR
jgi:hypothetical protein